MTLATPTTRAPPDTAQDTGRALVGQGPGGRVLSPNPPATLTLTLGDPAASHQMVEPSRVHREAARVADTLVRPTTPTLSPAPTPDTAPNTFAGGVAEAVGEGEVVVDRAWERVRVGEGDTEGVVDREGEMVEENVEMRVVGMGERVGVATWVVGRGDTDGVREGEPHLVGDIVALRVATRVVGRGELVRVTIWVLGRGDLEPVREADRQRDTVTDTVRVARRVVGRAVLDPVRDAERQRVEVTDTVREAKRVVGSPVLEIVIVTLRVRVSVLVGALVVALGEGERVPDLVRVSGGGLGGGGGGGSQGGGSHGLGERGSLCSRLTCRASGTVCQKHTAALLLLCILNSPSALLLC